MTKAIIFDCFGVLATSGWIPFRDEHFSGDAERYAQATALNKLSDGGKIPYAQFMISLAALANITNGQAQEELEHHTPNRTLLDYIARELRPHYRIGMLSNAGANFLEDMFTPDQITLFDAVALSYETGALKPDAPAYELIAEHLGVAPADCIFIDDQPAYVEGARATGMQAIQYQSLQQMQRDLTQLLN